MKHIRILSLSLALVLMLGLFTACGKRGSGSESTSDIQSGASTSQSGENAPGLSTPEQGDVSVPDASQSTQEPETPETTPEEKPQPEKKPDTPAVKPDFSIPETGSDETVIVPMPGTKPEEKPEEPAPEIKPEEKPVGVDLEAFYQTIFTDPENTPAMLPMEADAMDAFYPGLTTSELNQRVAYMPPMTAVPCEIVMVECTNAADVNNIKAIFQARINAMVNDHTNYPMVIEAWETEAKIVSNGNFVALFVISGMTDEVVSNFNALF